MIKRVALYARVSAKGQSTDQQIDQLRSAANLHGYTIIKEYVDDGISGIHGRDRRPALDEMLNDCLKRRFDLVMTVSIDRIGRNISNLIETVNHIQSAKIDICFLREALDTTSPAGKMMLHLFGIIGSYVRDMILERTQRGREFAKKNGVVFGRPRVVTETTRKTVRMMREQGVSIKDISTTLNLGKSTVYAALN